MKQALLGIILLLAVTLGSGLMQGRLSNRWGAPPQMLAAAEKLAQLPSQFGPWRLELAQKMAESVRTELECAGYVQGAYVNQETGDVVSMVLLVGPTGPIAVHTPEICYSSRAHQQLGARESVNVPEGGGDEFWRLNFRARDVRAQLLKVYYAWSRGDRWVAAKDPRFSMAGGPYLYKIQLASIVPPGPATSAADPCRAFLEDFLPAARPHLVLPSP